LKKRYDPKVDVYFFGVILWEMVERKIPSRDKSAREIYDHVITRGWRLPIARDVPESLRKLIDRCWHANPDERPDFTEIIELFRQRRISFRGAEHEVIDTNTARMCPLLDLPYMMEVLRDPGTDQLANVVKFLANNINQRVQK
jgi:serine/threonine protein kinase